MRFVLLYISLAFLVLASCDEPTPNSNDSESGIDNILNPNEDGSILGSELGDEKNDVISRIKPHIISEMPDEITARIPLNMKDSTFYDIDYDFKEGKLYNLDLDIYPKSGEDCALLFQEFKSYYNSIYGSGQEKDGFMVWYTVSKTGKDVEIMMMNESESHQKPYLAITFFQEENISK